MDLLRWDYFIMVLRKGLFELMKKIIIEDNYGRSFEINDIDNFKNHLINFHSYNGKADNSLHEENGYYFTVNEDFYNMIMKL